MLLELRVYQMNRFVFVKTQKYVNIRFHLVVHGLSLAYRVILIVGLQGLGLAYTLACRNLKASTLAIFRFLEKISFKSLVVSRIVKIDTSCYVHGCAIDRFRKKLGNDINSAVGLCDVKYVCRRKESMFIVE